MEATQFSGFIDKSLLERIDRLFTCNVGEYVNLPQLVILGDQSSGKSSVLAGLTGLLFPRDSSLCTRFATQIIFKKSENTSTSISILADNESSSEYKDEVAKWHHDEQDLDATAFANVLKEAAVVMGVGKKKPGLAAFSTDVLRIEICGPQQEHFSVIDVPGLFRKTTEGVTSREDRAMVDEIVSAYMENPRSIMLTVIPANVDVTTQDILERAVEVDPGGIRTFGILTKPDLVDRGAEHTVIDILEGRQHKQRLGWHLLRNPGQADSFESRKQIEADFFRSHLPWSTLKRDKVGIEALKIRLQAVLAEHLRREFPKVKYEISQRLKETYQALDRLGPKRESQIELTRFVVDLATRFQALVGLAMGGQYRQVDKFSESTALRLATNVINRSESFALAMEKAAHAFEFVVAENSSSSATDDANKSKDGKDKDDQQQLLFATRLIPTEPDVAHIVLKDTEIIAPWATRIMDWLNTISVEYRGFELGTLNSQIVGVAIKIQAAKWRAIALGYVSDIINLVHSFILAALKHIAPDNRIFESLQNLLVEKLGTMYEDALLHTKFLLQIELNGIPATHNALFPKNLATYRKQQATKEKYIKSFFKSGNQDDGASSSSTATQIDYVKEIHDILQAYYSIARARFVDNVRMQVCDYYLVECTNTEDVIRPLEIFSAKFAASLSLERLEEVVGEDEAVKRTRKKLEREIEQLNLGRQATEQGGGVVKVQEEADNVSAC